MASDRINENAQAAFARRYLPVGVTTWEADVSTSTGFGPFTAGDWVCIVVAGATHVETAATGGAALATHPQLPAGVHDFTVPEVSGVDNDEVYVHLLGDAATGGVVYKVS